jgi:hypothetical protein
MNFRCLIPFVLGVLLFAVPLRAQSIIPAVPTAGEIFVIAATGDPNVLPIIALQATPIAAGSANCSQPALPPPTLPLQNPSQAEVDDPFQPANLNLHCRLVMPAGVANGLQYRAVSVFTAPNCTVNGVVQSPCISARSVVGIPPFDIVAIVGPPLVPTNLNVKK